MKLHLSLLALAVGLSTSVMAQSIVLQPGYGQQQVYAPDGYGGSNVPAQLRGRVPSTSNLDDVVGLGGQTRVRTDQSTTLETTTRERSFAPPTVEEEKVQTGPVEARGKAHVVNGGIVVVEGQAFALDGLTGPSAEETCMDLAGLSWKCGQKASRRLETIIDGRIVNCTGVGSEANRDVLVGSCRVGREDLARTLVLDGYATGDGRYEREQHSAKQNRRGIWSSGPVGTDR